MSITLDDIPLHEDLYWADEFGWSPVASSLDYALSGAGIVQAGTKLTGRTVTLEAKDDSHAWTDRGTVLALKTLADEPGRRMTLNYHGRVMSVMFAPGVAPFDAEPVWREWPDDNADLWIIKTVRLIQIGE